MAEPSFMTGNFSELLLNHTDYWCIHVFEISIIIGKLVCHQLIRNVIQLIFIEFQAIISHCARL